MRCYSTNPHSKASRFHVVACRGAPAPFVEHIDSVLDPMVRCLQRYGVTVGEGVLCSWNIDKTRII